jgi:hypothetical protein
LVSKNCSTNLILARKLYISRQQFLSSTYKQFFHLSLIAKFYVHPKYIYYSLPVFPLKSIKYLFHPSAKHKTEKGGRQKKGDKKVDKTIVYGQGCFLRTIFHSSRRMCSTCVVIGRCSIGVQGNWLRVRACLAWQRSHRVVCLWPARHAVQCV